jgi:hypothetical protein
MAYRLAGRSTELCSCNTPCPCAFGEEPTGGTCEGVFCFDIQEGEADGVDLSGTKALLATRFSGPWTGGNFTAALLLDENDSDEQRGVLERVLTGQLGGDAANLVNLVGDMKGVFVGPFDYSATDGDVSVRVGDLVEGAGSLLRGADESSAIEVSNALYPLPHVFAGRSTKTRVNVAGLSFQSNGSGMWTGPFELKG